MITVLFPFAREPAPLYLQIQSEFAKRIRKMFLLVGVASILSGPALGLTALVWGFQMLEVDHVLIMAGAMLIAWAALVTTVNGIVLLVMRSHVSVDHVKISSVRVARRMLLLFWILTIDLGLLGSFSVAVSAGQTNYPPVDGIASSEAAYLVLALVAVIIGGVDFFLGNWLARSAPRKAVENTPSADPIPGL